MLESFCMALDCIFSKAGMASYNSPRLCVDGGNTDPVLSGYATSGRRQLVKAKMLNSSTSLDAPKWPVALFPSHFST